MTENNNHKYQVWAAIITATGGILVAVIALFSKGDTQPSIPPIQTVEIDIDNENTVVTMPLEKANDLNQEVGKSRQQNEQPNLSKLEPTKKLDSPQKPNLPQTKKETSDPEDQTYSFSNLNEINRINEIKNRAKSIKKSLNIALDKTVDERKAIKYQYWLEYFDKITKYNNQSIIDDLQEIERAFVEAKTILENE